MRDWQTRSEQWMLGKSFDGHAPVGPAIVTTDKIGVIENRVVAEG